MNSNLYEQGLLDGDKRTRETYRRLVCECIKDFEENGHDKCAKILRKKFEIGEDELDEQRTTQVED